MSGLTKEAIEVRLYVDLYGYASTKTALAIAKKTAPNDEWEKLNKTVARLVFKAEKRAMVQGLEMAINALQGEYAQCSKTESSPNGTEWDCIFRCVRALITKELGESGKHPCA